MRIRYKPWAKKELEESPFFMENPQNVKNLWKTKFPKEQPIHLELGCGKGSFIAKLAVLHPTINYIAIDLVDPMLGLANRNIQATYQENNQSIDNVLLTRQDISRIAEVFGREDTIDRIYINFCNPWPRGKHHKKRLTHPRQLEQYKQILAKDGMIYFKTDDDYLFADSLGYLQEAGFTVVKQTNDLAQEPSFWNGEENIETEHEKMFQEEGIKIKACIAKKDS